MESKRVSFAVLLLLIGVVMMLGSGNVKEVEAKVCPFICLDNAAYMTCTSTGDQQLFPSCNCCFAGPSCSIFRADGTKIC